MKITIGVALFLLAGLLSACGTASTAATPTPAGPAAILPAVVSASGKVAPVQWATLSFPVGGTLADLKVQTGDRVKAQDVLAQLDDSDAQLQVAQAKAALAMAQAQAGADQGRTPGRAGRRGGTGREASRGRPARCASPTRSTAHRHDEGRSRRGASSRCSGGSTAQSGAGQLRQNDQVL